MKTKITKLELQSAVQKSVSKSDVIKVLNLPLNAAGYRRLGLLSAEHGVEIGPFVPNFKNKKYFFEEKDCPVCKKRFTPKVIRGAEGTTCSKACANTHFRSGVNNPNWKEDRYQSTCFEHHKKECVVCQEELIVVVHHLDHDRTNNHPTNLIPMCPTHHQYWHSRFKYLVEDQVTEYAAALKAAFDKQK